MNPYRRCVLLTYRFLTYVADLNYIMLLFDVRLGWVTCDYISRRLGWVKSVKSWVGLGWVGLGWVTENGPTAMSGISLNFMSNQRVKFRLGTFSRSRDMRISAVRAPR